MKKIIPIVALIGASSLVVLGAKNVENKKEAFINNINSFTDNLSEYTSLNEKNLTKTAFNKYNLAVISEELQDLEQIEDKISVANENDNVDVNAEENNQPQTEDNSINEEDNDNLPTEETVENSETIEKMSTLYSLSNDIENSCDDFCELKEDITEAIIETQNLINKIQNNELELTQEQRMFITEQSSQLKNLGRRLSNITTELNFHLSDLNQLMTTSNDDIDSLNLKYLLVLDNLVNGNEMLQSGLSSLNLINQMFNMRSTLPPNNQGRVLYGFRHNNEDPIIKDYYINEDGELVENTQDNETDGENQQETTDSEILEAENKNNVDTYQNRALKANIDTYNNTNVPRNIDSFFNTALLDNEFMYGNGGYGYAGINGMYSPANPYMQNYANYERNTTNNSGNYVYNTQNGDKPTQEEAETKQEKKEKKRIKLKKNIDTYKDDNEPDIKTKLGNIKNSISGFFGKFKRDLKLDLNDKIDNPIYRSETK